MSDNLTKDKLSNYHNTTTNSTTTATSIMVLISQENSSFNLLSRFILLQKFYRGDQKLYLDPGYTHKSKNLLTAFV